MVDVTFFLVGISWVGAWLVPSYLQRLSMVSGPKSSKFFLVKPIDLYMYWTPVVFCLLTLLMVFATALGHHFPARSHQLQASY